VHLSSLRAALSLLQIRRRVKQVPVAFHKVAPTSLFSESDFAGWTFKYDESNEKETTSISDEHGHSSAKLLVKNS
jgi:U3 small nucleolar RNA-associated protein 19